MRGTIGILRLYFLFHFLNRNVKCAQRMTWKEVQLTVAISLQLSKPCNFLWNLITSSFRTNTIYDQFCWEKNLCVLEINTPISILIFKSYLNTHMYKIISNINQERNWKIFFIILSYLQFLHISFFIMLKECCFNVSCVENAIHALRFFWFKY